MTDNLINEIRKRTYRYYYEDGLVEIAIGLQFLVIGLALWVVRDWLEGAAYALVVSAGLVLLIWQGALGVKFLVTRLKTEITYPRTGVVHYQTQNDRRPWRLVIAIAAIVLVSFFLPEGLIQMPVMVGTMMAVILFNIGGRVSLRRFQIVALLPMLAGIWSMIRGWEEVRGVGFSFVICGVTLILTGAWTFRRYLKENPLVEAQ